MRRPGMPLSPLAGFILAYLALILLASRGARAYTSIAAMITVYAIASATPGAILESATDLAKWNDVRVFVFIFLSMLLAGLMREAGLLQAMVDGLAGSSCRLGLIGVPALIGLMPMPGGALVSAVAMKEKYLEEARLSRDDATYLNYWFRHVWVPSWPLFQSIVITASVLMIDPTAVVAHTWPGTPAAILGGLIVSGPILLHAKCRAGGSMARFLASTSPLIGLAILFLAGLPLLESLLVIVLLVALLWRPSPHGWRRALGLALRPTIHLVLLESLLFKNLLLNTQAGEAIAHQASSLGIPVTALVYMVPFILGLAAGGENFFAATAIPVLVPYLGTGAQVNGPLLATAYLGGFLGVMASPVHLCLALTVEYYEANLARVLAKVVTTIIATTIIGLVIIQLVI